MLPYKPFTILGMDPNVHSSTHQDATYVKLLGGHFEDIPQEYIQSGFARTKKMQLFKV